jgi:hypothetical protein
VQWREENREMGGTAYPDIVVFYNFDSFGNFGNFDNFNNFLDNFNSAVRGVDASAIDGRNRIPLAGHGARLAESLFVHRGYHVVVCGFRNLIRDPLRDLGRRIVYSFGHGESGERFSGSSKPDKLAEEDVGSELGVNRQGYAASVD